MRKIWFITDDYGDLIRFVVTASGVRFWYPAVDKKVHALFASWGDVDEWGSPKEKNT
jgi:hypothetical protein